MTDHQLTNIPAASGRSLALRVRSRTTALGLSLFAFVTITGCASFPAPNDTVADAMASVRGAEELGAEEVPAAALQLQLARDQVAAAEALMADGENERAHYTAKRASEDADLAIALVRENEARNNAGAAKAEVESVEAEVNP